MPDWVRSHRVLRLLTQVFPHREEQTSIDPVTDVARRMQPPG
jgi:hypothetical protein